MNKMISSLLATTAACFINASVLAYPVQNNVSFTCPAANTLSFFGDYIAGFGSSQILGQTNSIYFQTLQYPGGVPDSLANYNNSGTTYDMVRSFVTCSFASSNASENPFDISYYVTNGRGGLVLTQSSTAITIAFPVGLK